MPRLKRTCKGRIPKETKPWTTMRIHVSPAHEYITRLAMAAQKDRIVVLDEIIERDAARDQ
jgi:hypothetical protein